MLRAMASTKPKHLQIASDRETPRLPFESARAQLGGLASGDTEWTGRVIRLESAATYLDRGVIVHAEPGTWDVWIGIGRIQRMDPRPELVAEDIPDDLLEVAHDARKFAHLLAGDEVRCVVPSGTLVDGVIVERCRFGALVRVPGDRVLAVSFRRLWPASSVTHHA